MVEKIKEYSEIGKNGLSLLRDALIFILIIVFLVHPPLFSSLLGRAKVDTVSVAGVTVKMERATQQAASAAEDVATAKEVTAKAISEVEALIGHDPTLKPQFATVLDALRQTNNSVSNANEQLSSAGRTQQQVLAEVGKPPASGWVSSNFLTGQIGVDQTAVVKPPRPLNLRSGPGSDNSTLGTLFPGTQVRIVEGPKGTWVRVTTETSP